MCRHKTKEVLPSFAFPSVTCNPHSVPTAKLAVLQVWPDAVAMVMGVPSVCVSKVVVAAHR